MISVKRWRITLVPLALLVGSTFAEALEHGSTTNDSTLSLKQAVKLVQANDPWLIGNQHSQDAIEATSIAAGTLPDPKMSLGLANIAADSFDFSQEGMTQFKIGVSQMFPRGDTLMLRKTQLKLIGSQFPFQRENRKAEVSVIAAKLWLDIYRSQESITLIESDRSLFEQLVDVAQASYSSAVGKTRQQDIVRAQLELTRIDDRLTMLKQQREMSQQQLYQWLSDYLGGDYSAQTSTLPEASLVLSKQLPDIFMLNEVFFTSQTAIAPQRLYKLFSRHPAVNALDQKIKASKSGVDLAKQKYKPEWGVNAGYGIRSDAPNGMERSDLFSIGVSFDIPLFTTNRQDKQLQSAISTTSAIKTEKWLLLRKLIAQFESNRSKLVRLNERQKLYQERLLPQMHDQAEASLTAYTNDDGDFAEVVRSRIAELNASIDALNINVERQKSIIQLNYFFMNSADQIISSSYQIAIEKQSIGENK